MFTNRWMQANAGGSGGGTDKNTDQQKQDPDKDKGGGQENAPVFDTWIKDQKPEVVKMLDTHTKGLKTALDAEREIREGTERQLRDLAKKAEKGSEAEKQLTGMADQISTANRRSDFYEEAHRAGITNLKMAFLVATEEKLFDSKGRVNFEAMKKDYPELFGGTKIPDGDAGSGTEGGGAGGSKDMNKLIRNAAGRSG